MNKIIFAIFAAMKKFFQILVFFFIARGEADIVALGGSGQTGEGSNAPSYPLAETFNIGQSSAVAVGNFANVQGSLNGIALDSYRGTVLYFGIDANNNPLLFRGSVVSSHITRISIPHLPEGGEFNSAAFDSNGNAILVGDSNNQSILFRLPFGASQVVGLTVPGADPITLLSVAMGAGNTAIMGGVNANSSVPVAYILPEGASSAISVTLPNLTSSGQINSIAVGPDGTAILAGVDNTHTQALIYRLPHSSTVAEAISIPDPADGGQLNGVAIDSNGTAILVGATFSRDTLPLIYRLPSNSSSASIIANAGDLVGIFNAVAIGPNGVAVLGGTDDTNSLPLIWRVASGATTATSAQMPNATAGRIISVAVNSQNIAVLGGAYDDATLLAIFTLGPIDTVATPIGSSISLHQEGIVALAIYESDGLYDIRRLRACYYLQQTESLVKLSASGL